MNKAATLAKLRDKLNTGRVLDQATIDFQTFKNLEKLKLPAFENLDLPKSLMYVVRSSVSKEDTNEYSNAGKYLSKIRVKANELNGAIAEVFSSYGDFDENEIVLIQPYLEKTARSGVVFSHNPNNGQSYLIDNYVISGDTNEITSGSKHGFKHVCLTSPESKAVKCNDDICQNLRQVISECKSILDLNYLDIEYAIDQSGEIYIFQARPLIMPKSLSIVENQIRNSSTKFIEERMHEHTFLAGKKTIFGVMPDWNPAEMIGRRPKQLALSLYRELITDSIWAYQRDNYGYKTLRSFPLLVEICHQPFIDTRVSFNSLLPKDLDYSLERKLVNYYLDKLEKNKHLHDKIEFEIVLSSWTFDLQSKIDTLPGEINSEERIDLMFKLKKLTQEIINSDLINMDIDRIIKLQERHKSLLTNEENPIYELYWLLEDCKRWGTLPFAGLARAAFVATQIIKSLEKETGNINLLTEFLESLNTITSQMGFDLRNLPKNEFLSKYGHLRPGTYDITSRTYNEAFNEYFSQNTQQLNVQKTHDPINLVRTLDEIGLSDKLGISAEKFIIFARKAIYWREQSKFEFTKNLSKALDLIIEIGSQNNILREDLAYLDIKDLIATYSNSHDLRESMLNSIKNGKRKHEVSMQIELPSVISEPTDIYSFTERDAIANFITLGIVSGVVSDDLGDISDKIVLLEGADPGYDWIFQKNIRGLITAYGGANSHMAIRCSELRIPAVIGIGERRYAEVRKSMNVFIDCANRILEVK